MCTLYFLDVKHQEAQTSRDLFHESVPKSIKFAEKTSLKKDTCNAEPETEDVSNDLIRPLEECVRLSKQDGGYSFLTNDEIVQVLNCTKRVYIVISKVHYPRLLIVG